MYTIKSAASLTGIAAETLRAWERRYGYPRPLRTASGYRLYDDEAIATLRRIRQDVASGIPPSQAVPRAAGAEPAPLPDPGELVDGLAGGRVTLDDVAAAVASALGRPLTESLDGWLMPLLREVGEAWASGRVSVADEHAVSAVVARALGARIEALPAAHGPVVLVGLPAGARHELGPLAFTALARASGLRATFLGADLPSVDWGAAVRRHRPRAAVVAVAREEAAAAGADAVAAVRAADPDVLVAVGGGAQDAVAGVVHLGEALSGSVATLWVALEASGAASD